MVLLFVVESFGVDVGVVIDSFVLELSDDMALRSLVFRLTGVNEFGQQFKIDGFVEVRLSGKDFVDTNIWGGG